MPYLSLGVAAVARVQIEMVADVVCPYCYIGLHRLQQAVAESGQQVDLVYTPFVLRRSLPKEGVPKVDVFRRQFGSDAQGQRVLSQVAATAAADGLCFDLEGQRAGNSEDAHRLLLWASDVASTAQTIDLFESMVRAYNCERGWLGDHEVLMRAVSRVQGLDGDAARAVLADESAYATELEAGLRRSSELGVRGVPAFFVDGRPLGSGALPAAELRSAIMQGDCRT
jgi:predicted DsbA family dithiol-disulfide isomerase